MHRTAKTRGDRTDSRGNHGQVPFSYAFFLRLCTQGNTNLCGLHIKRQRHAIHVVKELTRCKQQLGRFVMFCPHWQLEHDVATLILGPFFSFCPLRSRGWPELRITGSAGENSRNFAAEFHPCLPVWTRIGLSTSTGCLGRIKAKWIGKSRVPRASFG